VDWAVVVVSVEAKRKEKERTNVIKKTSKAKGD
jgi:hypothetical protein